MSSFSRSALKVPILSRLWTMYPKAWKYVVNIGLFIKYKTLNIQKLPSKIKLPSSFTIHINPTENRGRALLIKNGITQQQLGTFWRESVSSFMPSIVLDIGVNYGECLFSVQYPEHTKIFGIEANHHLMKYVIKSLSEHPNRSQMRIIHAFASNENQQEQEFYIDKNWSGTSGGKPIYSDRIEKDTVQTITIDSLLNDIDVTQQKVLFKIDVEGYEAFVLEGMKNMIEMCKELLGIIEFDSKYIKQTGVHIDEFIYYLSTTFELFIYDKRGTLQPMTETMCKELQKIVQTKDVHLDIVLHKRNERKNREW
ncbi:FkbM family methyltransferase [Bacillus suaedaesalsae]|uniref:FkbM family methyltransferase n=1 Tax=Bacillus suaedaesalsae TaxID=2810349 RepID=A0ABS2DLZ5_9BACI|nr:FkbM family methyltransferase [Bacillus suaedaesalsae]MBM6619525.1 FkbM family methyltransferase [Bacillus suaedaesalsae]